jgi:hypothetical protein
VRAKLLPGKKGFLTSKFRNVQVRYVIDFYGGKPTNDQPVSFYLDVRPALDDFESARDRALMFARSFLTSGSNPSSMPEPAAKQT